MVGWNFLRKLFWFLNEWIDWLEKSITQIDLFSRRHRGMLENEKAEEYFTSGNSKIENENDEEQ